MKVGFIMYTLYLLNQFYKCAAQILMFVIRFHSTNIILLCRIKKKKMAKAQNHRSKVFIRTSRKIYDPNDFKLYLHLGLMYLLFLKLFRIFLEFSEVPTTTVQNN